MNTTKQWCLLVRIKKNDSYEGKRTHQVILETLERSGIAGATAWAGVAGYGRRGKSGVHIEGLSINMPLVIEAVDDLSKIETALAEIKKIVGANGLVTLHEVGVL